MSFAILPMGTSKALIPPLRGGKEAAAPEYLFFPRAKRQSGLNNFNIPQKRSKNKWGKSCILSIETLYLLPYLSRAVNRILYTAPLGANCRTLGHLNLLGGKGARVL
jgi:hypothetical protein